MGQLFHVDLDVEQVLIIKKSERVTLQKQDRRQECCTAMILVKRENPRRWAVRKFVRDHNHPLVVSFPNRRPTHLAKKVEKLIDLPYVVKGMDVSFSGILSYLEATAEKKIKNNEGTPADLCHSLQESVFPMLVEITKWAKPHTDKKDVLIVAGVGCNERLQEMMRIMCSKRGGRLFATDDMYCVDNGAMIVYTGLLAYANWMSTPLEESSFTQRFRTDEVLAIWREKKKSSNGLMEKKCLITYMFQGAKDQVLDMKCADLV